MAVRCLARAFLFVIASLVLVPAAARAQSVFTGTVKDTSGAVMPGEYVIRIEGNDSSGVGGGGFQCCWSTAYVKVSVKAASTSGR